LLSWLAHINSLKIKIDPSPDTAAPSAAHIKRTLTGLSIHQNQRHPGAPVCLEADVGTAKIRFGAEGTSASFFFGCRFSAFGHRGGNIPLANAGQRRTVNPLSADNPRRR
jgi:hypothetical protein